MKNKVLRITCLLLIFFLVSIFWGCFGDDTVPDDTETPTGEDDDNSTKDEDDNNPPDDKTDNKAKHTLSIEKNTDKAGTATGSGEYKFDESVTLTATENEGYEFIGWYNGETSISSSLSYTFQMPENNVTYTAKWIKIYSAGLTFELDGDNYIITGYTGEDTEVLIPEKYQNIDVTEISERAFYNNTEIIGVEIPDSVEVIGSAAFSGCTSLKSITIPFIGANINYTSNSFFGYIFGASNFTGNQRYVPKSLKTVIITGGDGIYTNAFWECDSIISITLPESLENVDNYAFWNCNSLEEIKVPSDNAYYTSVDGVLFDKEGTTLILYPNGKGADYIIPEGVTGIAEMAFAGRLSLERITIPDSMTSIEKSAFSSCYSLEAVYISDIEAWCKVIFENGSANPLCNDKTELYLNDELVTNLVIPDSILTINNNAFYNYKSLVGVTIGNTVTAIGEDAFNGCTSLTNAVISDSVTEIDDRAFKGCTLLASVTIGRNVSIIGIEAFMNCKSLVNITLPASLTQIGERAFQGCTSLVTVRVNRGGSNGITTLGINAFYNCTSLATISVPYSSVDDYKNASNWKAHANKIIA